MRFLADTNLVSAPVRRKPDPDALRFFERHVGETALPSVVWYELRRGRRLRLTAPLGLQSALARSVSLDLFQYG